jgi:hypothetical protein
MQTRFVLDCVPNAYLKKQKEIWGLVVEKSDNQDIYKNKKKNSLGEKNDTSPTHVGVLVTSQHS